MVNNSQILNDRYRIIKTLGQGGMSKVYLAENIKLGTLWAIKEISRDNEAGINLLAEPDILKNLDHPALPRVFDIIENDKYIYIVVDYIEGTSLETKLAASGAFSERLVIDWAKQLCNVLGYLHEHKPYPIIYRDMKPSNIILTESGSLKLIDFGIAREYKSHLSNDTVYIGTRGYAAPEQYGSGQTSVATDIYSLGVTLYQLLTGRSPNAPPYEIKPVRQYDQNLSAGVERVIKKCTRQDPAERYQSASEMLNEIIRLEWDEAYTGQGKCGINGKIPPNPGYSAFKRMIITVWDNYEFGCELAYMAAKVSRYNILLADLDLLSPKADLCLNLKKYPGRFMTDGQLVKSGLDIVIDAADKNLLTPGLISEASMKRSDLKNLFVLTGNYKIENYEYYSEESLLKLIDKAYIGFDLTILLVNRSIYDSFTVISLLKSDFNIAAIRPDLDKLREINNYLAFLKDKQHMPLEKTKFIAYEYDGNSSLSRNVLKEATGNNLIGSISYSRKRLVYRNLKSAYAARMDKSNISEYESILCYYNIIPATGIIKRFIRWIRGLFTKSSLIYGGADANYKNTSQAAGGNT